MILIAIFVILMIVGIILGKKNDWDDLFPQFLIALSSVCLFLCFISIPLSILEYNANIEVYHSIKHSIQVSREKGGITEIERAAIQKEIIDVNIFITKAKYYNKYFDLWIPDEFTKLEPLE